MSEVSINKISAGTGTPAHATKNSLRILQPQQPLRETGPLTEPLKWPPSETDGQPRALRSLSKIIEGGLCHRCGSCVGICPTSVLGLDSEEYPLVKNLSACTDCDLCVQVCPGDEFDYKRYHEEQYTTPASLTDTHGTFLEGIIAYAESPSIRERSTSGGLVTALLLHLLETKEIDGAIVIASDENILWKGKPIVARTKEEILSAMKSKYAISPTNSVFAEIRQIPGRYAMVGLPCQIHGFVKAAELDARIKERIVLTIGLFCHAAIEHDAFRVIWESMGSETNDATKFISRIGKHPGAPHLEKKDGSHYPVYFGNKKGWRPTSIEMINILYRLYTPQRCTTCFDATSEFADISVGDPWMAPPGDDVNFYDGWSFALVRTARAQQLVAKLQRAKELSVKVLTPRETRKCNILMATEKRWRAFRIIETLRRQGKPIPAYGPPTMGLPHENGKQFVKTELHIFSHIFCFLPRLRATVLRFMLGSSGYRLLWLNSLRRSFRFWRRDSLEKIRRILWGRE